MVTKKVEETEPEILRRRIVFSSSDWIEIQITGNTLVKLTKVGHGWETVSLAMEPNTQIYMAIDELQFEDFKLFVNQRPVGREVVN